MGQKENNIQNVEDNPVSSLFTITAPLMVRWLKKM